MPGPSTPEQVDFAYDADGRRVSQSVLGGATTDYLWDVLSPYGDVALETDGTGAVTARYALGGVRLISQERSGTASYVLPDGQGSTRALTNASGSLTDTFRYSAFGETERLTGITDVSYLYTGQPFDALTGLYSLRARYYDPAAGRFLSRDTWPIDFKNPIELNRYGYVAANPVTFVDSTGHENMISRGILSGIKTTASMVLRKGGKDFLIGCASGAAGYIAGVYVGSALVSKPAKIDETELLMNVIWGGVSSTAWSKINSTDISKWTYDYDDALFAKVALKTTLDSSGIVVPTWLTRALKDVGADDTVLEDMTLEFFSFVSEFLTYGTLYMLTPEQVEAGFPSVKFGNIKIPIDVMAVTMLNGLFSGLNLALDEKPF